jgi:hypothetical protein
LPIFCSLFYHFNIARFLLLLLKCGMRDRCDPITHGHGAILTTIGYRKEQNIQPKKLNK